MTDPRKFITDHPRLARRLCFAGAALAGILLGLLALALSYPPPPQPLPADPVETTCQTVPATEAREPAPIPWNLLLVNPWNGIPEDFTVELAEIGNGHAIDARACPDFQAMMDAMGAEGLEPLVCSSYRTMEKQQSLYERKVDQYLAQGCSEQEAQAEAGKWIAVPGTSEHQTGLALDIVDRSYQILDEKQENTPVQKWLMAHSWEYGFILRYPNDKTGITGIYYEPWHYRYVGREAAEAVFEQGICLEEYLERVDR